MGKETIREGKWFAEAILNDLVEVGQLSAKSVGGIFRAWELN